MTKFMIVPFVESAREMATMALAFIQGAYSMTSPADPGATYPALLALTHELDAARASHPYSNHPVYFASIAALCEQMPVMPAVKIAPEQWLQTIEILLHEYLFGYLERLVNEYMGANRIPCYDLAIHKMIEPPPFTQDAERIDQAWVVSVITTGGVTVEGRIDLVGMQFQVVMSVPEGDAS